MAGCACPDGLPSAHPSSSASAPASFAVFDDDLASGLARPALGASALAVRYRGDWGLVHRPRFVLPGQIADARDNVCAIRIGARSAARPRLQQLMENPSIEKVFHFARFDVAARRKALGCREPPVLQPRWPSALARTYSSRHGLKEGGSGAGGCGARQAGQSSDCGPGRGARRGPAAYAANDVRFRSLPVGASRRSGAAGPSHSNAAGWMLWRRPRVSRGRALASHPPVSQRPGIPETLRSRAGLRWSVFGALRQARERRAPKAEVLSRQSSVVVAT